MTVRNIQILQREIDRDFGLNDYIRDHLYLSRLVHMKYELNSLEVLKEFVLNKMLLWPSASGCLTPWYIVGCPCTSRCCGRVVKGVKKDLTKMYQRT